jgi:hypothetical protein
VTDAYYDGDQFDFTINGVDEGPTSTPANDGTYIGGDFVSAFASPLFSHSSYILAPGDYTVTGVQIAAATGFPNGGTGGAELVTVPEPTTWALMLLGFAGLGASLRSLRRATLAV